jgi:glycyl-tRNA synthetase
MSDIYEKLLALARRRGFFYPSFELYGGVSGFQEWGPLGCELKRNLESLWRKYFIYQERMVEIESPTINPYSVLKASGHVNHFFENRFKCSSCGSEFREPDLKKCPECGGRLEKRKKALMFETSIGKGEEGRAFLRPETAQGIFINFLTLNRYFRKHIPFGVCQLGKSYRNELSPRKAVIRLKEFSMMEAEVFYDPEEEWDGLERFRGKKVRFLPRNLEKPVDLSFEEAVEKKIISSKPLAYYMGVTNEFLLAAGINPEKFRFRQHVQEELAHYAKDCWDAEAFSESFGWIELVGLADRTCYDLKHHSEASGIELTAERRLKNPKEIEKFKVIPKMDRIGPKFRGEGLYVKEQLEALTPAGAEEEIRIKIGEKEETISPDCYRIEKVKEKVVVEKFYPHVVEPSFGTDRIIYMLLEHAFSAENRQGEEYRILALKPVVAPIKVGVFPLIKKGELVEIARSIERTLRGKEINAYYDEEGSIGRRYARMDEAGTPYCITVDQLSLKDNTVTVRNRDDSRQVRVKIEGLPDWLEKNLGQTDKIQGKQETRG